MSAAVPCPDCVSSPVPLDVRRDPALDLPASVAWLPGENPGEAHRAWEAMAHLVLGVGGAGEAQVDRMIADMDRMRGRGGHLGPNETGAERARRRHAAGHRTIADPGVEAGAAFLSSVILALAARGFLTILTVAHRSGWMGRVFGKSPDAAVHLVATGPSRAEGVVESKVLEAVVRETGPKTPHGPSPRAAVRGLFAETAANPERDLFCLAKDDAVARGLARWVPLNPPPLPGNVSERDRLKDRLVRAACYYEILPAHSAAVASAKRALDDLRSACDSTHLVRLAEEIEGGLSDRTLRSPD